MKTHPKPTPTLSAIMLKGEGYFKSKIANLLVKAYDMKRDEAKAMVDKAIESGEIVEMAVVGLWPGVIVYQIKPKA